MNIVAPSHAVVLDSGIRLEISFDDVVRFHGRTSIGGAALGFRLIQRALTDLTPEAPPERATIHFVTAFPGPGLRDAIEMVTRAVTRGAYKFDLECAPVTAPEAAKGRFWFEVTIAERKAAYQPPTGLLTAEFIDLSRKSINQTLDANEANRWTAAKEELAACVMALTPNDALVRV